MAEKGRLYATWTGEKIYHFALSMFASVLYDLFLVMFQVFEPYIQECCPAFMYSALSMMLVSGSGFLQTLVSETGYLHPESPVDESGTSSVCSGRRKNHGELVFVGDRAPIECTADDVVHFNNHLALLQDKLYLLGKNFRGIVSQVANYKSDSLEITAAGRAETSSILQGLALPSFCRTGESRILPGNGTDVDDCSGNFSVSLPEKALKIPKEHDWVFSAIQDATSVHEKGPSDAGASEGKTEASNQNGGQKASCEGIPAAGVCKSGNGGRPNSSGSSGSGGDDGGDDRRPNVPAGGCRSDSPCDVNEKKEGCEKDQEEQKLSDSDDDGHKKDDDVDDQGEKEKCSPPEGIAVVGDAQVVNKQTTSISSESSECTSSSTCFVPESCITSGNGSEHQIHRDPSNPFAVLSVDGAKKPTDQGLKLDVNRARRLSQAAACQPFLGDQLTCCYPGNTEISSEAEVHLQKAFTCRHNTTAWEQCNDASCQKIQQCLSHTQNCHLHVLGGCKQCIQYKGMLLSHASRCKLPRGNCHVEKCDDIRKYMEANSLPDNRHWKHKLDDLFFGPNPPRTPTLSGQCHSSGMGESDDLMQSFFGLNTEQGSHRVFSDDSMTPVTESSLSCNASGVWNQYHIDRPPELTPDVLTNSHQLPDQPSYLPATSHTPDLTVTRGPTADSQGSLQQHTEEEQASPATPFSAVCAPDTTYSQVSGDGAIRQDVIWPLNMDRLSVGKDGCYLEHIHWGRKMYIGGGSCGRVSLCTDSQTGFLFAVKLIPEDKFEEVEIKVWGKLSGQHPNILELYGAVKSQGKVTIFMEFMEGGSVKDVGQMHEVLACHIFGKVLSAVDFMHSQGIVHRDIKGANILLGNEGQIVKLADFGTSIWLSNGYQQDDSPRGTEPFMAPEVCRSHPHSFSVDIWSLMCVLYEMLKGTPPWELFHHCRLSLLYQIATAKQPPPTPPCSPDVEDLFSQGFQLQPADRPTARKLLNHRVFVGDPDVSNLALPIYSPGYDPEYESSLSSLISGATESVVSGGDNGDDDDGDGDGDGDGDDDDDVDADADADADGDGDGDDDDDDGDGGGGDGNGDGDDGDGPGGAYEEPQTYMAIAGSLQGQQQPDLEALSAEEQLQSLQSDLFYNLSGEELERMIITEISENSDLSDNDINLFSSQEDFDVQFLLDQMNLEADMQGAAEWSYSMSDLTKLHIKDSDGNLLYTVRERPTTSFGILGKEHHGNIASLLRIDAFTFTRDDGSPLDVHAEIGGGEQSVRVVRAHDTDNWQAYRWRVDVHGLVEQTTRF